MRAKVHRIVTMMLLAFAAIGYAADPNSVSPATLGSAESKRVEPIGVEQGFRKALGSIRARADLMDPKAAFCISRTGDRQWLVQVDGIRDLPAGGLSVAVGDSGPVEIRIAKTNAEAGGWLSSAKASAPDATIKIRPEVALRQAIHALTHWWNIKPDCFFSPEGKITLKRRGKEEWEMRIYRYSVTGHPEWRITIKDNVNVEVCRVPAIGL